MSTNHRAEGENRPPKDPSEWTVDEIMTVIPKAIADHEFEGVNALLKLLAVRDPYKAQAVLDAIDMASAISDAVRERSEP